MLFLMDKRHLSLTTAECKKHFLQSAQFAVIDWLMHLPVDLDRKLGEDIQRIVEEHKMPYVSSIERIGIEKGRAEDLSQGQKQGQARILQKLLAKRFGMLPNWAEQRILTAQPEQLEDWSLRVLDGKSVEDVLVVQEEPAKYAGGADG